MNLSLHYYALHLGNKTSRLYEGFRDTLIDIQDEYFPVSSLSARARFENKATRIEAQRAFMTSTDTHFDHYFVQDPLWLVLVGKRKHLDLFGSVSLHGHVVLGEAEGDFSAVSVRDLGRIVWPVVKTALAGSNEHTMRTLSRALEAKTIVQGLEAVGQTLGTDPMGQPAPHVAAQPVVSRWKPALVAGIASLFVDENYQVKGDRSGAVFAAGASRDVGGVLDDAVDVVIEKVLSRGGDVVFLDSGSMGPFQRIALIPRDSGVAENHPPGIYQIPAT